ncbi:hypothetical protein ACEU59_20500 [Buttiauxella noackiae]|uniref:hypothetical protein n=1 Tax=Buttiauxella noackiae TaxID=82992 RepID=UPI0035A5B98C
MSSIKELSLNEIALVSGGNANSNYESNVGSAYGRSINGAGAGYGAVPNIDISGMNAAAIYAWANRQCIGSMTLATANAIVAARNGNYAGYAATVASALADVGSTCDKPSGVPFR